MRKHLGPREQAASGDLLKKCSGLAGERPLCQAGGARSARWAVREMHRWWTRGAMLRRWRGGGRLWRVANDRACGLGHVMVCSPLCRLMWLFGLFLSSFCVLLFFIFPNSSTFNLENWIKSKSNIYKIEMHLNKHFSLKIIITKNHENIHLYFK